MPLCVILRDFDYSGDGFTVVRLKAGTEHDILAGLIPGLRGAGLVTQLQANAVPYHAPVLTLVHGPQDDPGPSVEPARRRRGKP
jgi:hypothetical protein